MEAIRERIEASKEMLLGANNDRDYDLFMKGMVRAFNEVLDIELELPTEEEIDE